MSRKTIDAQPNEGIDKSGSGAEYLVLITVFVVSILVYTINEILI
jgi:hypothetical protein